MTARVGSPAQNAATDAPPLLRAHLALTRDAFALDLTLNLAVGEVLALLGPNGSGKSTVLELLAGLLAPDTGTVLLGGVVLTRGGAGRGAETAAGRVLVAPERRGIGLLGQDALLFPHLSARANVEFAIRVGGASASPELAPHRDVAVMTAPETGSRYGRYRSGHPFRARSRAAGRVDPSHQPHQLARSRAAIRAEADAWLARVGLAGRGDALPAELSGGQQQRVALARALAARPRVLLLDEPLAALDAETAPEMRQLIREQLAATGTSAILVTHDVVDAVVLADRVAVLHEGRIIDVGATAAVLEAPRNPFVAALAGVNLVVGRIVDDAVVAPDGRIFRVRPADAAALSAPPIPAPPVPAPGSAALATEPDSAPDAALADSVPFAPTGSGPAAAAVFRPSAVVVQTERPQHASPRNVWPATITGIEPGSGGVRLRTSGNPQIIAEVTAASVAELGLGVGSNVWLSVKATEVSAHRR
ncbi:ATP-binding cassette domain-containing protein [Cryobacterium frigoriphilum]|uniref:ATP-binding cassette domain-containing protein n=1 Tax=Cryobacterium frigoriphilum TaxID=1259150 RepID=A0A4R8ZUQ5_9MICO|nr:ATP-binding cassette domain-containing protein [Cryobacterium frigoriphilum]TFD46693.1 ATP-binding cassette domain-containing protein [Cryobacterium frigoriphilum]